MTLNELAKRMHEMSVKHGWWIEERKFPEIIALCHSELSESLEEYRNGKPMDYRNGNDPKPEGIAVEMVDCMVRIMDYLAKEGVDIDAVMEEKLQYNETRPFRHGGKVC